MDSFYWIVLAIAVVFLIIGLTATGMMLRHEDEEAVFPKSHAPCPDGWKQKGGKCYLKDKRANADAGLEFADTFDSGNYGTHTPNQPYTHLETMPADITATQIFKTTKNASGADSVDTNKTKLDQTDHGFITFNPEATICQKKAWADHHKIRWDGITNYNNC